ncbi:WxcM-like domain-containing protein [Flavobacterium sp. 3HN19-14]|uniref:WxcM-like domain-containing protein n=1 Tax=Flavobacterium sp. 3HN19-14 TaxID=3448133 RepID=UPI003EE404D1
MKPEVFAGNSHTDHRGTLFFNNDFDATVIKRFYVIENANTQFIRAWQGHKIEQRWFSALKGSFEIKLIEVDDWESPSTNLRPYEFTLDEKKMNILHVPKGYISSIQALETGSKLLVMADYLSGEIKDEYRYDAAFFENKI